VERGVASPIARREAQISDRQFRGGRRRVALEISREMPGTGARQPNGGVPPRARCPLMGGYIRGRGGCQLEARATEPRVEHVERGGHRVSKCTRVRGATSRFASSIEPRGTGLARARLPSFAARSGGARRSAATAAARTGAAMTSERSAAARRRSGFGRQSATFGRTATPGASRTGELTARQ